MIEFVRIIIKTVNTASKYFIQRKELIEIVFALQHSFVLNLMFLLSIAAAFKVMKNVVSCYVLTRNIRCNTLLNFTVVAALFYPTMLPFAF